MPKLTQDFWDAAKDVKDIRKAIDQPLGKVIADILGDKRIKQLFDEAGKLPDEYKGLPTGEAALKMGVITENTRAALLVAQAAEHTLLLAHRVGDFLGQREDRLKELNKPFRGKKPSWEIQRKRMDKIRNEIGPTLEIRDPVFEHVGSEKDPVVLQQAQGTWMTAQMYLNHEIEALREEASLPDFLGRPRTQGKDGVSGFRQVAIGFYAKAAQLLEKGGHTDAAKKFRRTAKALKKAYKPEKDATTPCGFVNSLYWSELRAVQDANIAMGDDRWSVGNEDILQKLIRLTGNLDTTNDEVKGLTEGTDEKLKVGKPLKFAPRNPVTS